MKAAFSILAFSPIWIAASCASMPLQSPDNARRVVLGSSESSCRRESSEKQWYILFGAVPLNHAEVSFQDSSRSYRIIEERTWSDLLITILGGTLTTVTRKTLTAEICEEQLVVATPEQIEQKRKEEIQTALDGFIQKIPGEPIFLLKSGEKHRGRIEEISQEEIVIAEMTAVDPQEAAEKDEGEKGTKIARILLRDGSTLTGEVLDQTPLLISLKTTRGKVSIQKSNVRRISYQETQAEKESARKQREEASIKRLSLRRDEILRIVLPGDQP